MNFDFRLGHLPKYSEDDQIRKQSKNVPVDIELKPNGHFKQLESLKVSHHYFCFKPCSIQTFITAIVLIIINVS